MFGIYVHKSGHHDLIKYVGSRAQRQRLDPYHNQLSVTTYLPESPGFGENAAPAPCYNVACNAIHNRYVRNTPNPMPCWKYNRRNGNCGSLLMIKTWHSFVSFYHRLWYNHRSIGYRSISIISSSSSVILAGRDSGIGSSFIHAFSNILVHFPLVPPWLCFRC